MPHLFSITSQRLVQLCFALILLSSFSFTANAIKFSEPNQVVKMHDANWKDKQVEYQNKHKEADLTISLDQQQYPYLKPIIDKYAQINNKNIVVSDGTCGVSAGKLRRKQIDIGGFCCPLSRLDRLPGLQFHTLGIGSLALIANNDVPVNNVTIEQAKKIFSGNISTWSEISQNKADILSISPIVRPHCDKRPGHWRLITPNKADFATNKLKVGSIPDMLKRTSRIKGAVGYETLWMVDQYKKKEPVKLISINGLNPNDQGALEKGNYPFYRTFSLTTWGKDAKPIANDLISYLIKHINSTPGGKHTLVGADKLRENGWVFEVNELVAEPKNKLYGRREG